VRRIGGDEHLAAPAAIAPRVSMHVVEPRAFNDAKEIGDKLRVNSAVIMNLQHANADLAKRLVDFASGLTYMAQGSIKKVGERIFLLTPPNVEVSAEEARELMSDRGFFNQF
jgi:cell division inhibitor SepF